MTSTNVHIGDAATVLETLPDGIAQAIVTSPPYYMQRDYGVDGQIGLEATPAEYVARLVEVFQQARRVLRLDGTLWLNLGDTYNSYLGNRGEGGRLNSGAQHAMLPSVPTGFGLTDKTRKNKCLLGIPWRVAHALSDDGWILRSEIVWHKPNAKPGGGKDRPAATHEKVFLFSRSPRYLWTGEAPRGDVWTFNPHANRGEHRATMPKTLAAACIMAGSERGDVIIDPFHGSGTTGAAASDLDRNYIGIELNPDYIQAEGVA